MIPIAILPAAGLLLGVGGAFSNPNTLVAYPLLNQPWLQVVFKVMAGAGDVIFGNLALLLSIGLAIGLAKKEKGVAALAALTGFIVMNGTMQTLLGIFAPEGATIDTGVIGSLVIGSVAVFLHNRYHNIQLPQVLGFFGGSRFIPIITSFFAVFIGCLFFIIWPPLQTLLIVTGKSLTHLGVFGTFLYGFILRLTGALGLHHMVYSLFWYTELGGQELVAGQQIVGAQKIFFAQLADPKHTGMFTAGTRFFAGRFATMMFGLPGAALAMYHAINPQKRRAFAGLFLGVALTSFVTGITEPLEFMFLFVFPPLYVLHAFFDGLSFLLADFFAIRIGNTFSGGVIDFILFGVLQGQARTHWLSVIPIGIIWFFLYYFSFKCIIIKFNVGTPGRSESEEASEESQKNADETEDKKQLHESASKIIVALGGKENIEDVDACITRLRVSVKETTKVDKSDLKKIGAIDVLEIGGGIQAIYGAKAILYKNIISDLLGFDS